MDVKSLEVLQRPDDRARYFTPFGLGQKMDAEAVAEYHQQLIGRLELADAVPEQMQTAFNQLREFYGYGVLWYDLYTVAHDRARLILEGCSSARVTYASPTRRGPQSLVGSG